MLANAREFMNKSPWMGWALAGLLLAFSAFWLMRGQRSSDPYDPERMKDSVVIKFSDTGEEITMTRGELDRQMRRSGDKLDMTQGVINPATGKATGFPFNKSEWEEMITRINAEKQEFKKSSGNRSVVARKELPPTPPPAPQPPTGGK